MSNEPLFGFWIGEAGLLCLIEKLNSCKSSGELSSPTLKSAPTVVEMSSSVCPKVGLAEVAAILSFH